MLLLLSIEIIFRGERSDKLALASVDETAVFPIAFPLLVGPGAITSIMISIQSQGVEIALVSIAIVQLAVTGSRIRQNPYRNSYLEAARLLQTHAANGATVIASAEWAFALGFDNHLVDDFRLGFRSGKKGDVIIMDEGRYGPWIAELAWQDPANHSYIQRMLAQEYSLINGDGYYKIYVRSYP